MKDFRQWVWWGWKDWSFAWGKRCPKHRPIFKVYRVGPLEFRLWLYDPCRKEKECSSSPDTKET